MHACLQESGWSNNISLDPCIRYFPLCLCNDWVTQCFMTWMSRRWPYLQWAHGTCFLNFPGQLSTARHQITGAPMEDVHGIYNKAHPCSKLRGYLYYVVFCLCSSNFRWDLVVKGSVLSPLLFVNWLLSHLFCQFYFVLFVIFLHIGVLLDCFVLYRASFQWPPAWTNEPNPLCRVPGNIPSNPVIPRAYGPSSTSGLLHPHLVPNTSSNPPNSIAFPHQQTS